MLRSGNALPRRGLIVATRRRFEDVYRPVVVKEFARFVKEEGIGQ